MATPDATVPEPIWVPPSIKTTVPVGGVANEVIVAVNVTAFDRKTGFALEVSPNAGEAGITVRVTVAVAVV